MTLRNSDVTQARVARACRVPSPDQRVPTRLGVLGLSALGPHFGLKIARTKMCETPPRMIQLCIQPPKAPRKSRRYVPRTRNFTIPPESPQFESFMYCNEELSPFFQVPPLPRIEAYSYELRFVTGRTLSKFILTFRFYINDSRLFFGILAIINDPEDTTSNLTRGQKANLAMQLLNGLASPDENGGRKQSIDLIYEDPLFWRLHQTLGMEFFKNAQVKIVYPDYEEAVHSVEVPLFDEDYRMKRSWKAE